MARLLPNLRAYLAGQGIVREPDVAGSVPPMWLEPRNGTPAPGEGQNATEIGATLVVGAFNGGGIAPRPYESFQRQDIVDFVIRATTAPAASDLEEQLRAALTDKRAWQMNAIQVIESQLWRPMQLLVSDAQGFTYRAAWWLQRYA